jgi:anti-sigma B factor antagonist
VESKINMDNIKIVALSGRLDSYTIPNSRKLLDEALQTQPANIVVNMQAVTFVDSTALSALVQAFKRSREQNGNLRLCCLQQGVRMIFELTRLDKVFEIFPSENEAVEGFKD